MKIVRMKIDLKNFDPERLGLIDVARVDATTEEEIQAQMMADDQEAMHDAAKFVRRVRKRLGLSQAELSWRIEVSIETIGRLFFAVGAVMVCGNREQPHKVTFTIRRRPS